MTEQNVSLPVDWLVQVIVMAKKEFCQSLPSEQEVGRSASYGSCTL